MTHASTSRWAMSSCVLKWQGLCTVTMFEIGRIQAYSVLQIAKFPSPSTKLFFHGVASWTGFKTPTFQHLIYFLLESFFQVNWNWSTRGLLWCHIWNQLNVVWGTWEASNIIKYIRKALQNLFFVTNLGTTCCWLDTAYSFLELWMVTLDFVFLGWPTELVIKLALGGRYSSLVHGWINPSPSVVVHDNKTLPSFVATKNVISCSFLVSGWTR